LDRHLASDHGFFPLMVGLSRSTNHANQRTNDKEVCKLLECRRLKATISFVEHIRETRNVVIPRILVTGIGENPAGHQRSDGA
jgi:hypothetical protein